MTPDQCDNKLACENKTLKGKLPLSEHLAERNLKTIKRLRRSQSLIHKPLRTVALIPTTTPLNSSLFQIAVKASSLYAPYQKRQQIPKASRKRTDGTQIKLNIHPGQGDGGPCLWLERPASRIKDFQTKSLWNRIS